MSKPVHILLVEDDPHDAELAIAALRQHHLAYHLVHVIDGREALDFLFGTGPHVGRDIRMQPKVVMLDLKLPKVGGIEVLQHLRSNEHTKQIPVVVLTSSREDRDVREAYRLGVNSFIVKPVNFEHFSEAVGDLGRYWLRLNEAPI